MAIQASKRRCIRDLKCARGVRVISGIEMKQERNFGAKDDMILVMIEVGGWIDKGRFDVSNESDLGVCLKRVLSV